MLLHSFLASSIFINLAETGAVLILALVDLVKSLPHAFGKFKSDILPTLAFQCFASFWMTAVAMYIVMKPDSCYCIARMHGDVLSNVLEKAFYVLVLRKTVSFSLYKIDHEEDTERQWDIHLAFPPPFGREERERQVVEWAQQQQAAL